MTLPNVPGDEGSFQAEVVTEWQNLHNELRKNSYGATVASIALQSFPYLIGRNTERAGGNAMGLKGRDGGRFLIELSYLWLNKEDDQRIQSTSRAITQAVRNRLENLITKKTTSSASGVETYLPYFLNDAGPDQPVIQSYGRYQEFAAIQKLVDPEGFFKRIGGFKY
jgi:hypothetical protein